MNSIYIVVAYFIGLVDLIAGLICIFKGSRLKPNTYLGFRIPSAFLTQNIWSKINVLSGILGSINFVIIVILSLFVQSIYLMVYAVLSIMLMVSALSIYSRRIIEFETGREKGGEYPIEVLPTIKIRVSIILFGWAIMSVLIVLIFMSRSQLPEILAVHFSAEGRPDVFMHRDEFIVSFVSIALGGMILITSLLYSIKDVPSLKEFESYNKSLVSILQLVLVCIPLLLVYVYLVIYLYNALRVGIPTIIDAAIILALISVFILNIVKHSRGGTS